ncbi:hypothetical protein AXG93_4893s1000 [Marchantia polymorpha subsp. ruderalis]|uniref:Uncharacterized protein n=1 Tax=Marchantia polymorpha subsp. ruderalis TaxID=1480154 RepID=A0A176WIV0_MARPO|nr:hypothetical protein AXG93_4893s1000 [Marchantia polymorpha subsp. ruderalis]
MLRGERIHCVRIFWTATRQRIGVLPGGSTNYLSPFLINFYRELNEEAVEREREVPVAKDLRICAVPSVGIRRKVPLKKPAEVLTVSSDTEEDPVALEKVAERVVEGASITSVQRGKYAGTINNGSFVEQVRNRTRAKVATTSAPAAKERQLQETGAKYEVPRKRLAEEVEKRRNMTRRRKASRGKEGSDNEDYECKEGPYNGDCGYKKVRQRTLGTWVAEI